MNNNEFFEEKKINLEEESEKEQAHTAKDCNMRSHCTIGSAVSRQQDTGGQRQR